LANGHTLSDEHLCNVLVVQSLCKFAARESEFGQPRSDKCTSTAAQTRGLPEPDELAEEIIENLEAALDSFREVLAGLNKVA